MCDDMYIINVLSSLRPLPSPPLFFLLQFPPLPLLPFPVLPPPPFPSFPGEEDATYINWMMVKKGPPQRCECGHWFELIEAKPTKI